MGYKYENSPSGDSLFITGCEEGHVQLVAKSGIGTGYSVPVCVRAEDAPEIARQILGYARSSAVVLDLSAESVFFVLTDALSEWASRQRAEAADDPEAGFRVGWADLADSLRAQVERGNG